MSRITYIVLLLSAFVSSYASAQPPVIEFTFPASVTAIAIETSADSGLTYSKTGTVTPPTASIVWDANNDDDTRLRVSIDPSYFDPNTGPLDQAYDIVGDNCVPGSTGNPVAFTLGGFIAPQDPANGCSITITERLSSGSGGSSGGSSSTSATPVPALPLFGLLTLGGLLGLFGLRKLKK